MSMGSSMTPFADETFVNRHGEECKGVLGDLIGNPGFIP